MLKGNVMQAVLARAPGGPEVLNLLEVPDATAGPGEVCIEIHASTVNPTDTMRRSGSAGWHSVPPQWPIVLGMEAAGVVDEVGLGADFEVGDAVMAVVFPKAGWGTYAERVLVPATQVTRAPRNVDLSHAATVPMNGLTALLALEAVGLPAGESIAVTGAAGALGGYVIELARVRGLHVIADSSPADQDLVCRLGANVVVPRGPDVAAAIRKVVPAGVRGLVDCSYQLAEASPAVMEGGVMVTVRPSEFDASPARAVFVNVTQAAERIDWLVELRQYVEEGRLTTRVAHELPLASAETAHRLLERGGTRGRIVLRPATETHVRTKRGAVREPVPTERRAASSPTALALSAPAAARPIEDHSGVDRLTFSIQNMNQ
jgi:NADPH2:quinone reductase